MQFEVLRRTYDDKGRAVVAHRAGERKMAVAKSRKRSKTGSKSKRSRRAGQVKTYSKNVNKRRKSVRRKLHTKLPSSSNTRQPPAASVVADDGDEEEVEKEDFQYLKELRNDLAFISTSLTRSSSEASRSQKRKVAEDSEATYEKRPRISFSKNEGICRELLPFKIKNKIIHRVEEISKVKDESVEEKKEERYFAASPIKNVQPAVVPQTLVERVSLINKKMFEVKKRIALLSCSLIENPNENKSCLKELRLMLEETDPDILIPAQKLVMVSLMEVFKDIAPGYKIRIHTDKERKHKLKKDTKNLQDYEEFLLRQYKHYLEFLQKTSHRKRSVKNSKGAVKGHLADEQLREVAIKCLCGLLVHLPHFNFRSILVSTIVPFMNHKDSKISGCVCEAVKRVFQEDKLGEASLETVKMISKMIKGNDYNVESIVLDTFLTLKITEVENSASQQSPEVKKHKKEMSRSERKRKKQMEKLNNELLETKAEEDKNKKLKLNTSIIEFVFVTYVRILRKVPKSKLLSSVLEGLAKFSFFINVDFFDDIFKVMNTLINSGDLTRKQSLHCVLTAFVILSGQGSALNIDPMRFYQHFYSGLFQVHAGSSSEDLSIVLDCLNIMIFQRKNLLSQQRVLAYVKRLCTLCLQVLASGSVSVLGVIRNIFKSFTYVDLLLDNDQLGNGIFQPELESPDYCNASNTCLWELQPLQNHYHPSVAKFANNICHGVPVSGAGQLPSKLTKLSPKELLAEVKDEDENFLFIDRLAK